MSDHTHDSDPAKRDDPEMREALVRGTAQYILRGRLHTVNLDWIKGIPNDGGDP